MKTSIIICFYERLQHLKCCLDSLKSCSENFDEVIIADDGSEESCVQKVKEMIAHYDFRVIHVWQPKAGFRLAASRNNGIRNTRCDYLVFLDCDFLVTPGSINYHLKFAKPKRFVVSHYKYLTEKQTNKVFNTNISEQLIKKLDQQLPINGVIKEHRKFVKNTILRRLHLISFRKLSLGGFYSIHRKDIEHINGYDENFIGWGGEDEDLGRRLIKAGIYGKSVTPYARALHMWHPRETGNKHWKDGPNIEYFNRKNIPFFCENGLIKKGKTF